MSAFTTAVAVEIAQARVSLMRAQQAHDEDGVTEALERLRDLEEIQQHACEGL